MSINYTRRAEELLLKIVNYDRNQRSLPGISNQQTLDCFVRQLIDSIKRVDYFRVLDGRPLDDSCCNPSFEHFDPIKAAIVHRRSSNHDEACWLAFLAVHFGKSKSSGWRLVRDIYGGLGEQVWTWSSITNQLEEFSSWHTSAEYTLKNDGVKRAFGNHRKYESIGASAARSLTKVFRTYIQWVGPEHSHGVKFSTSVDPTTTEPPTFDDLYCTLGSVLAFGRTARFDYLCMLAKLKLADIRPRSPYLRGSTGPLKGARILFGADSTISELERNVIHFADSLELGMQEMEDALCNWQKDACIYRRFSG